jgi:hypothetical protein
MIFRIRGTTKMTPSHSLLSLKDHLWMELPSILLYDPRLTFMENTIENPLADGGGEITVKTVVG